jgi:hypothetical protein
MKAGSVRVQSPKTLNTSGPDKSRDVKPADGQPKAHETEKKTTARPAELKDGWETTSQRRGHTAKPASTPQPAGATPPAPRPMGGIIDTVKGAIDSAIGWVKDRLPGSSTSPADDGPVVHSRDDGEDEVMAQGGEGPGVA